MAAETVVTLDANNFEAEVVKSDVPVFVDFWAQWCGPCRMVAPIIDQLAQHFDGKIKVAKMDIDANQDLAFKYNVTSIPTFILFKDGEAADRMMGAAPKGQFEQFINRNLT